MEIDVTHFLPPRDPVPQLLQRIWYLDWSLVPSSLQAREIRNLSSFLAFLGREPGMLITGTAALVALTFKFFSYHLEYWAVKGSRWSSTRCVCVLWGGSYFVIGLFQRMFIPFWYGLGLWFVFAVLSNFGLRSCTQDFCVGTWGDRNGWCYLFSWGVTCISGLPSVTASTVACVITQRGNLCATLSSINQVHLAPYVCVSVLMDCTCRMGREKSITNRKYWEKPGVVLYTCNPSTQEPEAEGGYIEGRLASYSEIYLPCIVIKGVCHHLGPKECCL